MHILAPPFGPENFETVNISTRPKPREFIVQMPNWKYTLQLIANLAQHPLDGSTNTYWQGMCLALPTVWKTHAHARTHDQNCWWNLIKHIQSGNLLQLAAMSYLVEPFVRAIIVMHLIEQPCQQVKIICERKKQKEKNRNA